MFYFTRPVKLEGFFPQGVEPTVRWRVHRPLVVSDFSVWKLAIFVGKFWKKFMEDLLGKCVWKFTQEMEPTKNGFFLEEFCSQ